MTMTHGSLFSGIGGFDLAASWMGWKNAFHCEIDEFCSRVLKYHFPDSEHYGNIKTTDFTKWRGKIDVLSGGFPCQPFSVAGRRRGAEDDRYLWPEMLRAVREIRPTWIVGENVAGILTMVQPGEETPVAGEASVFGEDYEETELRQRYVVETVCTDLEREGYSVQPLVIPACAVGAPHRRDRVWFIARRTQSNECENQCGEDFVAHRDDAGAEDKQREGADGVHPAGFAPYSECGGGREVFDDIQSEKPEGERTDIDGGERTVADTYGDRCRRGQDKQESVSERQGPPHAGPCGAHGCIPDWACFPTQSPVCQRDDGISGRLDGITFPRWRAESIKAYGNAVVPQVVYEIFRAIELAEKEA